MYKKVYVEITNICNLSCSFCIKNQRTPKYLTKEEFTIILDKLKDHTKYLYFHVLGEPLMHPLINDFINEASKNFFINITTNGYLIDKIIDNKNIRQINISLHSFDPKYNISLEDYLNNIFKVIDKLANKTYFALRLWTLNKYNKDIISLINKKFNTTLNINELEKNNQICKNVFLNTDEEFIWPSLENTYYKETGKCYALKDHIGILSNGVVVPCCLDSKGDIPLGNIFEESIDDIIRKDRYQTMLKGFKENKKEELLCKKCNFLG